MVFTTHFGLHSQTNRLLENVSYRIEPHVKDGIFTLCDVMFQWTCTCSQPRKRFSKLQFAPKRDFKFELFPLHSPLLGESLLVSFPPLIDMLKFSGSSYLIWDHGSFRRTNRFTILYKKLTFAVVTWYIKVRKPFKYFSATSKSSNTFSRKQL
jgi:hypothetical protein